MPKIGDIIESRIDRWDGGVVGDSRDPKENVARMATNWDIHINPRKLVPFRQSESGDSSASTSKKQNFAIARETGTTHRLYALGVVSGTARAEILSKGLTTGASNDLDDATWASVSGTAAKYQSPTIGSSVNFGLFVYYRKTGRIYGARDGTHIFAFDPSETSDLNDTEVAISYTNISQGLVHSHDDILYVPIDNKIYRNDNGNWNGGVPVLILPEHYYITCIAEYGTRMAIAVAPISGIGNSRVFIWSRDLGTNFLVDSIDWGEGRLDVLEELEGFLVGVSVREGAVGATVYHSAREKLTFRYYNDAPGSLLPTRGASKFEEFFGDITMSLIRVRQKLNNRILFMMKITVDGVERGGVWSVAKTPTGFVITHERTHDNTSTATDVDFYTFFQVGDYLFQSYVVSGAYALSKTDDVATYATSNSIYETCRKNAGDSSFRKDLIGISITTEPLIGGSVIVAYKVDADLDDSAAWKIIMTHSVVGAISDSAVNIEGRTATMTIASPAVVSLTSHGLSAGDQIYFTTDGALPTGVVASTIYFVISTGLTTDAFRFSATSGGSAIDTSGSQSGTHTLYRVLDALPKDYREIAFRIQSASGEITSLSWKEKITGKRNYT